MNPSSASEMRPYECNQKHQCFSAMEPGLSLTGDWEAPEEEEEKEEEEDSSQFLNVHMRRPRTLRGSSHTYDSFRRHSWEPGKVLEEDTDFDQRSLSLKELAPDGLDSTEQLDGHSLGRRDPQRAPIIHSNNEMGSLFSQDEEDEDGQRMSQVSLPDSGQTNLESKFHRNTQKKVPRIPQFSDEYKYSMFCDELVPCSSPVSQHGG
ncbi:PREDICTED: uncharacterized protein LOC106546026 [Thamnophis sirtalis]|uniref:Uncharacterized protein LOC106546026 n=1 Tax=Thamnophis sirtalis TaxID=35019 RepID=A0A6I9XVW4_9SAUR|nr:PREDICTED: uncharacterized protein LOC106546026 [Thamnophis sirtalis]